MIIRRSDVDSPAVVIYLDADERIKDGFADYAIEPVSIPPDHTTLQAAWPSKLANEHRIHVDRL